MNIPLRKETIDDRLVYLDSVIMVSTQKNPANPKQISFPIESDEQKPAKKGNFCSNPIAF
jgi:hypothetical protein